MTEQNRYTKNDVRRLIVLRHLGSSWADVAKILERDEISVRAKARRLRDSSKWKLGDGRAALGAPEVGSGRPAKIDAPVECTFRVSEDVVRALIDVAQAAGVSVGDVIREALERWKRRRKRPPFELELDETDVLVGTPKPVTIGASLPEAELERCLAKSPGSVMADVVRASVHLLLCELGYDVVDDG